MCRHWCRIAGDGQGNYLAAWQQATAASSYGEHLGEPLRGGKRLADAADHRDRHVSWSYDPVVAMAYDPVAGVSKAVVAWGYRLRRSSM